jgi:hypothetical protein
MLLVMNTTSLFDADPSLTAISKERIHSFLPGLWDDVFKVATPPVTPAPVPSQVTGQIDSTRLVDSALLVDRLVGQSGRHTRRQVAVDRTERPSVDKFVEPTSTRMSCMSSVFSCISRCSTGHGIQRAVQCTRKFE